MARAGTAYQANDKDRAIVKAMAGYGIRQADIAGVVGIADRTLRKHYRHEVSRAPTEANAAVAQSLFHMATKGRNVAAAIFWMKTRAGWRETLQLANADEAPLMLQVITGVPRAE